MVVVDNKTGRLGPMYTWNTGSRHTNGVTTNFGGGRSILLYGDTVPVTVVCENVLVDHPGLIHYFPQRTHPIGGASGFAPAAPSVSTHDSLDFMSIHSRV